MNALPDRLRAGYVLVGLLTLAVYANSLDNPFHYDDLHSIVDNPHLRDPARIPSFFIDPSAFSAQPENAMYRPLLLTTFALNHAVGGYEVLGYHLVSLALHLGCAILVGGIGGRLLGDDRAGLLAAGLFALHPIHTEPVNYISSRSEILAAFFFLLAFWSYLRGGVRRDIWVGLAYAAALLSKSSAVVLPAVLVAYELCVRRRSPLAARRTLALLGGIGIAYVAGVWSWVERATISAPVRPFAEQVWTQVKAMVFYLKMLFWPSGQSVDHQFLISESFFDPIAGSATLFLGSLLWVAYRLRGDHPLLLFNLVWFFVVLAPASLVPLNVLVNEHRLYLPGAALAFVVAYGGLALARRCGWQWTGGVAVVLMVAAGGTTIGRNEVWRSEYALWGDAAAKAPLMARPYLYLGATHYRDGQADQAIAAFVHAVRRDPNHEPAYVKLGELYRAKGDLDRAVAILERGLAVAPSDPDLWFQMGEARRQRGEWAQCVAAYQRALEAAPDDVAILNNLGNTYQHLGQPQQALAVHERALNILPDDVETLLNLGNAKLMLGRVEEALDHYRQVVAQRDDYAGAWLNIGQAHERLGAVEEALAAYVRAVALDGQYADFVAARRRALGEGP